MLVTHWVLGLKIFLIWIILAMYVIRSAEVLVVSLARFRRVAVILTHFIFPRLVVRVVLRVWLYLLILLLIFIDFWILVLDIIVRIFLGLLRSCFSGSLVDRLSVVDLEPRLDLFDVCVLLVNEHLFFEFFICRGRLEPVLLVGCMAHILFLGAVWLSVAFIFNGSLGVNFNNYSRLVLTSVRCSVLIWTRLLSCFLLFLIRSFAPFHSFKIK